MRPLLPVLLLAACPALAGTWDDLAPRVFGDRPLLDGAAVITLDAPYRTDTDSRTRLAARIAAPEGTLLREVTLIIDENPMPVSAVIRLTAPQAAFRFDGTFRINGPTPLHLVAETADGRLFAVAGHVKTSGQGACAAPPGTDPAAALATLGQMTLSLGPDPGTGPVERLARLAGAQGHLELDIRHPSHSGMQMDQISLLYIPMRYVETLDIAIDGQPFATVTGSISLSENPHLGLSVPPGARRAAVELTDTDGTVTTARTALPGY